MKLFHGSKLKIESPLCKGSKEHNDYGPGFYLTSDLSSAKEWACRNNSIGYVNEYVFDISNMNILDLTDKSRYSVLNWVAILLHHRELTTCFKKQFASRLQFLEDNYYIDINKYDVVIGYRADDAYFRFPVEFVIGNLTVEQLNESFELGNLGIQICLTSSKSISNIHYLKSYLAEEEFIDRYYLNVTNATKRFDDLNKDANGTTIVDIIRNKKI